MATSYYHWLGREAEELMYSCRPFVERSIEQIAAESDFIASYMTETLESNQE